MTAGGFGMVYAHLRDKRILIVDDERELADMVAAILHGAGFTCVSVAHSGAEALAAAEKPAAQGMDYGKAPAGKTAADSPFSGEKDDGKLALRG